MITYVYGSLFYSPAQVLVNPVNTVGAMGTGLAYDFKRFYPHMFDAYRELCRQDRFETGQLFLYKTAHKWILNFPTKKHWRAAAKLDYLEEGLQRFAAVWAERGISSASFPLLGTGSGGLQTADVMPLMSAYLDPLPIMIYIHLFDKHAADLQERYLHAVRAWLTSVPQLLAFREFWRDVLAAARQSPELVTRDTNETFRVQATPAHKQQRLSLKLLRDGHEPIFIPETQLQDLWGYIQRAGYSLPHQFPATLDQHAAYLLPLLTRLPYLRPIELAARPDSRQWGLHYIPPKRKAEPAPIALMPQSRESQP
ncbi:macro domain-containing protein [bacterium]|nr:macro domain-containing protein [bacterium]